MARACATKRSLSSWTSYKKGLVDSGKSCGVLVVSPLIALMHAYAGVFTQTSSVKPNPFANVTIKIDVIFTFKLNACANSVYQAFPSQWKAWVRGYCASFPPELHYSICMTTTCILYTISHLSAAAPRFNCCFPFASASAAAP